MKKILVIATKFLGDLIISTPCLESLRKKFPSAEIVLLVRSEYENVLKYNPDVDRIISFDFGIRNKNLAGRIAEELSFWKKIINERFDTIISLQPGDRIAFLAWISGAKNRIAPRKQGFMFLFNILVDVEEDSISYLDYYNQIVSAYTGEPVKGKPKFFVPEENNNWAKEFYNSNGFSENEIIIAVHPGASEPTKIWPTKNYIELINELLKNDEIKILLIEGPKEEKIVEEISKELNSKNVAVYKSDDINKTAALLKQCKLLVANDTGTRHLSVALEIPVIALMPIDNKKCWGFYDDSDKHYAIWGERYFPASGLKDDSFLNSIPVDAVLKKVKEILK